MEEIKLTIHPFEMDSLKEAAKKIQEEAGEAFVEFLLLHEGQSKDTTRLEDELSDCIQACCNMLMRYGADPQAAMERCEQRNRSRGRYQESDDTETCGVCDCHDCDCGGDFADASAGVDNLRPKPTEEMSVEELIEALYIANGGSYYRNNSCSCTKTFDYDWCKGHGTCTSCRERLLDLLKAAHEREMENAHKCEEMQVDALEAITREVAEKQRQIDDLTHECDWLRNRLAELNEAGITRLHKLLRETLGEAKCITHNARVYIDKQHGSNNERCGDCGTDSGCDSCDCGVERAKEHVLSEEPPAQEMSEREAVIERLRELDFAQENLYLNDIGCAVLGRDPASWWSDESRAELRDKLIELIGGGDAE